MCSYDSPQRNTSSTNTAEGRPHLDNNNKVVDSDETNRANADDSVSTNSWFHPLGHITAGSILSVGVVAFSLIFPFLLAPKAAEKTYHFAFYDYDPDKSHFDNTFWTYGTDYILAAVMGIIILNISTAHSVSRKHAFRSRGLLMCYMVSVACGGYAHQFYTTLEDRNTASFRFLWTLCVGTVTAASGFMGVIGTELVRRDTCKSAIPLIPEIFWIAYGVAGTLVVIVGGLSFQRPACDIFIAGITQSPSTAYVMFSLASGLPVLRIHKVARVAGCIGFIMNAPLLPIYPLLVQYTDLSLAAINTMLHCGLCLAWGMQGLTLRHVEQALAGANGPPVTAVPVHQNNLVQNGKSKNQ
jgi:hypothetical protein